VVLQSRAELRNPMAKYRPLLLIAVCFGLAALVWMDNRGTWSGMKNGTALSQLGKTNRPAVGTEGKPAGSVPSSETAESPGTSQLLSGNPLASFDKSSLENWVSRPLFAPSRKRPPEQTAKKNAVKPPPPPDYKLLGVVLNRQRTIALLRSQGSGADFRVQVGDMIGGWHVAAVEKDFVTLERDGESAQTVRFAKDCDGANGSNCQ
jgi:hypothetical protein